MTKGFCILLASLIVTCIDAAEFVTEPPTYIKGCEIKKPEFTKCSTESIQGLFRQLKFGIPGLTSIPSFDPFLLEKIKINQGNSETVNIKVELSNLKLYGFADTIVKESQVSPKDYSWKTTFNFPKLKITGDYKMEGRILLIPLNSQGKIELNVDKMGLVAYTKTKLHQKGGFTFYNVTNVKIDYILRGLKSHLTNLFNGNKELEDSTNQIFNENWMVLADSLKPTLTQTFEDVFLDVLKKIFDYIPGEFFVTDIATPEELYGKKN